MANPLCHFELMSDNPEQCRAFYGAVFDWQFDDVSMPGYTLINTGKEPAGGLFAKPVGTPGVCMNIYFQVDDVEATLRKATRLGATVLVPKTAIPGIGYFALFTDPEGRAIGIMQAADTDTL